jgi:hypothetical protein
VKEWVSKKYRVSKRQFVYLDVFEVLPEFKIPGVGGMDGSSSRATA